MSLSINPRQTIKIALAIFFTAFIGISNGQIYNAKVVELDQNPKFFNGKKSDRNVDKQDNGLYLFVSIQQEWINRGGTVHHCGKTNNNIYRNSTFYGSLNGDVNCFKESVKLIPALEKYFQSDIHTYKEVFLKKKDGSDTDFDECSIIKQTVYQLKTRYIINIEGKVNEVLKSPKSEIWPEPIIITVIEPEFHSEIKVIEGDCCIYNIRCCKNPRPSNAIEPQELNFTEMPKRFFPHEPDRSEDYDREKELRELFMNNDFELTDELGIEKTFNAGPKKTLNLVIRQYWKQIYKDKVFCKERESSASPTVSIFPVLGVQKEDILQFLDHLGVGLGVEIPDKEIENTNEDFRKTYSEKLDEIIDLLNDQHKDVIVNHRPQIRPKTVYRRNFNYQSDPCSDLEQTIYQRITEYSYRLSDMTDGRPLTWEITLVNGDDQYQWHGNRTPDPECCPDKKAAITPDDDSSYYPNGFPRDLDYALIGTGNTTGEVMYIIAHNPTDESIFLPETNVILESVDDKQVYEGKFPGETAPDILEVEPGETDTIPVIGECLTVRKLPLEEGAPGPHISTVITPISAPPPINPNGPLPEGFTPLLPGENDLVIIDPITGGPFPFKIDLQEGLIPASPYIFAIEEKLDSTFNEMLKNGEFDHLPIPETQIETELPQLNKWYTYAILEGEPYTEEEFGERLDKQLTENLNVSLDELEPDIQEDWKEGKKNIFTSISFIGKKAKVVEEIEPTEDNSGITCSFSCPQNNTKVFRKDLDLTWECSTDLAGPFSLNITDGEGNTQVIEGIEGTQFTLSQDLAQEVTYTVALDHPELNIPEGALLNFTTNPDSMATITELNERLDELWEAVQNARDDLEGNPLVEEVRTIEMIRELLDNPSSVTDMFDSWLGDEFPLPPIPEDVSDANSLIEYLNQNLANIKKALTYAKKMLQFVSSQGGGSASAVIRKIDRALNSLETLEDFDTAYNELRAAVTDIRSYLGDKIEEYVSDRIQSTLRRILAARIGAQAAGAAFSAAMDAWNFIDALIADGRLDEAKKLYYLLYFDMLETANSKQRYHIDETWNSPTNGLPQVEWADCAEVNGKRVELEAIVKCWVRDEGGAINEGHWEDRQINFKVGEASQTRLVRDPYQSDCQPCVFPFQLDMQDLAAKAAGCDPVYVEIHVTAGGVSLPPVFSGVYNP